MFQLWKFGVAFRGLKSAFESRSFDKITDSLVAIGELVGLKPDSGALLPAIDAARRGDYVGSATLAADLVLSVLVHLTGSGDAPVMSASPSATDDLNAGLEAMSAPTTESAVTADPQAVGLSPAMIITVVRLVLWLRSRRN